MDIWRGDSYYGEFADIVRGVPAGTTMMESIRKEQAHGIVAVAPAIRFRAPGYKDVILPHALRTSEVRLDLTDPSDWQQETELATDAERHVAFDEDERRGEY